MGNEKQKEDNSYHGKRFEKGMRYPLHYGSKKMRTDLAGEVEILDIEYFDHPVPRASGMHSTIGRATIRQTGTKYYVNDKYDVDILYSPEDEWYKEFHLLWLTTKCYSPSFYLNPKEATHEFSSKKRFRKH
jgi:hypothetical protein